MLDDTQFDNFLRTRYVPEPPTNLAYRIIEAAKPRGQERGFTWAAFQRVVSEIFVIPQPAFAMAVVLMIGVYTGVQFANEQAMTETMARANLSSFVVADLSVDYGEFQ